MFELETEVRLTPSPAQVRVEIWGAGAGIEAALARGLGYLAGAQDDPLALSAAYDRVAEALGPAAIGAPRARREALDDSDVLVDRLRAGRENSVRTGRSWPAVPEQADVLGRRVRPRVRLSA